MPAAATFRHPASFRLTIRLQTDHPLRSPPRARATDQPDDPNNPPDDMPNTDLPRRLLSAFHHRNPQSGEWHKQCHCATQTDELCDFTRRELLISHPVSQDWDDEEHFFRDLNWADDTVSAHFAGYRWDSLLKLNSETWADAESFDFLENILPGRSRSAARFFPAGSVILKTMLLIPCCTVNMRTILIIPRLRRLAPRSLPPRARHT